jgi:predicted negative regulator of RcsB-dependent stress response
MATHIHEQEQVEALKRWWKENGTSVIAGIALGVAGIFGWNTWETYQNTRSEQASDLYMQLVSALAEGKYDLAEGIGSRLTSDFDSTSYADFARLLLAKAAIDQDRPDAAKLELEALLANSKDEDFRHIARLRLARVLLALGKPEEGLTLLNAAEVGDPGRFSGQYEEVKGDLYLAWGKSTEALEAYRKAIALGRDNFVLRMKLNDLESSSS